MNPFRRKPSEVRSQAPSTAATAPPSTIDELRAASADLSAKREARATAEAGTPEAIARREEQEAVDKVAVIQERLRRERDEIARKERAERIASAQKRGQDAAFRVRSARAEFKAADQAGREAVAELLELGAVGDEVNSITTALFQARNS